MPKAPASTAAKPGNIPRPATVTQLPGTSPAPPPKPKRQRVDLERLELDYRAGKLTLKEMGQIHGNVSHGRIAQIAKQHGWTRDVSTQARAEARAIVADPVRRAELTRAVTARVSNAAEEMAGVRLAHRDLILAGRGVVRGLIAEVVALGDPDMQDRLEKALDEIAASQRRGDGEITSTAFANLVQAVNRATGAGSRSAIIKNLATAAEKLVALERQAYELDEPANNKPAEVPPDKSMDPAGFYRWFCEQRTA